MLLRPAFCLFQLLWVVFFSGCGVKGNTEIEGTQRADRVSDEQLITPLNPEGLTLQTRFGLPKEFVRSKAERGSFSEYLRQLPLKPDNAPVLLYDGGLKSRQDVHAAVVDMEIGRQDLQQCADAVIRLRAEYLFKANRKKDIHFNFTSGDLADYSKYAQGQRAEIKGNSVSWQRKAAPSDNYATFRQYLDLVFTYAGSASLERELQSVKNFKDIQPGDVLIQGGHPGHAVIVLDMAQHAQTGEKIIMLAQSYMPAQDIHVLINPHDEALSPWYSIKNSGDFITPEWHFSTNHLKRFVD